MKLDRYDRRRIKVAKEQPSGEDRKTTATAEDILNQLEGVYPGEDPIRDLEGRAYRDLDDYIMKRSWDQRLASDQNKYPLAPLSDREVQYGQKNPRPYDTYFMWLDALNKKLGIK